MTTHYDYLSLTLARGAAAWSDFARQVRETAAPAARAAGGAVVGLFQGQLGFASDEAVLLLRGSDGGQDWARAPGVAAVTRETLTPTVRPADDAVLKPGGIYVHRWFTVDGAAVAEFIALSNQAWEGFEGGFDTQIFGLFAAAPSDEDRRAGAGRLLLLTWYASHGVWEASRSQTRDPAGLFVRRDKLTRSTIGRSSLSVSLAG